jgi:amidophosphoribosyltransferase
MKLIPVKRLTQGKNILFCDDSIVRGTQLKDTLQKIYSYGAHQIHMRLACPPLFYKCGYLNFSRARSEMSLATRRAIAAMEGASSESRIADYADERTDKHAALVEHLRAGMGLTSLAFQRMADMVEAIDVPKENLCTYCWDGRCG